MGHASGKNGGVYKGTAAALVIDDAEIIWTDVGAGAVSRESGAPVPEGTYFARATTTTVGINTVLIKHTPGGTKDLSGYDGVYWWARTGLPAGTAAGDIQLWIYESGSEADAEEKLAQPGLTDDVWRQCFDLFTAVSGDRDAVTGVEIRQVTDLDNDTFDIDDIVALAEVDGIKSWTLDYTSEALNTTDYGSLGVSDFIPGISQWNGTFEGYKEGVPLSIGSEVYLVLGETSTGSQCWIGKAIITGATPSTDHDGIVSYSYTFQGTGALEEPST